MSMLKPNEYEALKALAARVAQKHEGARDSIYVGVARATPPAGSLNRVFGPPLAITDATWPRFKPDPKLHGDDDLSDNRMEHAFTVDLLGLELDARLPEGTRAFSLFVTNANFNNAFKQDNRECKLFFWNEEDVARGFYEGKIPARSADHVSRSFEMLPLEVPSVVFNHGREARDKDPELAELYTALFRCSARMNGEEMWVQGDPDEDEFGLGDFGGLDDEGSDDEDSDDDSDEDSGGEDPDEDESDDEDPDDDDGPGVVARPRGGKLPKGYRDNSFLLQFDSGFAPLNLGDSGIMYVYTLQAFWQCF